jgi:hypothetical protein
VVKDAKVALTANAATPVAKEKKVVSVIFQENAAKIARNAVKDFSFFLVFIPHPVWDAISLVSLVMPPD